MNKATVKAVMAPINDLDAAQAAFEAAIAQAVVGEEIAIAIAGLFPRGVDAVTTSLGAVSAGTIRWTPAAETPTPWVVTASDSGQARSLSATVQPRRRVYARPAFTVSLGAVVAGQSVGAPGDGADVAMQAVFGAPGDPARTEADVSFTLLVDGVAARLPHLARSGETLIAQGEIDHPTGAQTAQGDGVVVSAPPVAPVFVEAPAVEPPIAQVGDPIRLSPGRAEGSPSPALDFRLTLDGADVTAQVEGMEWIATTPGALLWTVSAVNGVGAGAEAAARGAIALAIEEAAAPRAVADVLPPVMAVGEALAPAVAPQDGPNLVTQANAGALSPQGANPLYVAGDDGYLEFDIVAAPSMNNIVLTQAAAQVPVGAVLICENIAGSPRSVRFVHRTGGVNTTIADVAPGASVEHVVTDGFEDIRLVVYAAGAKIRVRIRARSAGQPQRDLDLSASFSGGAQPLTVSVSGLPEGISAKNGVITGDQRPAAGAGGDHVVIVRATDALGLYREVERPVRVTEPFSIQSVAIGGVAGGASGLVPGDTATMEIAWRGWPGPHAAATGLWPQWRRVWRDQNDVVIGSGQNVVIPPGTSELRASAWFQLDAAGAASASVAAAPVPVSAAPPAPSTPPVVAEPTSATVAGRAVAIAFGAATGTPEPTAEIVALTINGEDALPLLSGGTVVAPGAGIAQVAWVVAWSNAAGGATSAGSTTLAAAESTAPGVIAPSDWRVGSAVTSGDETLVAIDRVPADAIRLELEVAGVVQALDHVTPGVFTIGGRPAGVSQDYRVRAVNISGPGPWSDVKPATATAAGLTRFACWADGEIAHPLATAPTAAGSAPAMAEGVNKPFAVTGGGEAEVINWSTSMFKTSNPAAPATFFDGIFYDPLGAGAALKPAEISQRTLYTSLGATTLVVHGAGGMFTQPAMAAVGWDADGDPVPFRFDRMRDVGRLPDKRPFVVGPVRVVHNGGDPVLVTPDPTSGYAVVSDRGATLCVVARKGIIPPAAATATDLGLSHAYVRRAGAYNFAADGWDETAAAAAPSTGVTLRPTFEACGVYYAGAGTTTCKVRFRKVGDAGFYPAHDLWYDDRDLTGHPAAYLAASKHRGVLNYLEPGAAYEVQIKDGATYRKATVTTWSYKPAVKTTQTLGMVSGGVSVTRAGDTLTVARAGLAALTFDISGGKWAELSHGVVQGAITLADDVERLILRNVDNFGAPAQGIKLGAANRDIRILGGRSSGWASLDVSTGFGTQMDNAVWAPSGPNAMESVAIIGRQFGSPRYSASLWEEGGHPWGPGLFAWQSASGSGSGSGPINGRMVYAANSADAWNLRLYYDGIGGTASNKAGLTTTGGYGCDSYVGWNFTRGTADENAELEGSGANMIVAHNVLWCRESRPKTAIASSLGLSWVAHGPMLITRNLHIYEPDAARTQIEAEINTYKVQAWRSAADPAWTQTKMGRKLIYHETTAATRLNFNKPLSNTRSTLLGCWLRNNLMRANSGSHPLPAPTNFASKTHVEDALTVDADKTLDADWRPVGAALVGRGELIANVNDGGPFYRAAPDIGALMAR